MTKEKWVAFPEVTAATDGVVRMGWTGMPAGFDNERLQLNVGVLKRGVIGWGGYAALSLAAYNGDNNLYDYGVGLDGGGNAYATGTVVAQKAETSQFQTADDRVLNSRNIRSGHLAISWNITTLDQQLETAQRFDPKLRAKQLSREIGVQASKAVWKHNTIDYWRDCGIASTGFDLLVDVFSKKQLFDSILNYQQNAPYRDAILSASIVGVLGSMQLIRMFDQHRFNSSPIAKRSGLRVNFNDCIRDPLIIVGRPTRAAVASSLLASSRLVRPTPLKKFQ